MLGFRGRWTVISIMGRPTASTSANWGALDWINGSPLVKGPQNNPWLGDTRQTTTSKVAIGMSVFINRNTVTRLVTPAEIGAGWGAADDLTAHNGWELAAENGGVLYVDEILQQCDTCEGGFNNHFKEQAVRMIAFDGSSELDEPADALPAAAKSWTLYD
jgi:hypothetical protein